MGTLHLAVNVLSLISGLCSGTSCLLGLRSRTSCLLDCPFAILLLWTLAPYDYVIYCQARGLSGHTAPHGECACFFLEDSMPLEAEQD